jgi:hypothetical protein
MPVVQQAHAAGLFGRPILTPVFQSHDAADDARKGLYLACRYFCSCGSKMCTRKYKNIPSEENPDGGCPMDGQRMSCRADVVKDAEGKLRVQVVFFDKSEAIRTVIKKYGPDPSAWPYQSKARKIKDA